MLKLVLDTTTFVSAFFWKGNGAQLFRKIEEGRASVYITHELLEAIKEVIKRPKFQAVMNKAGLTPEVIVQKIVSVAHLVGGPQLHIDVCRDSKDNKILECAVNANADYIISGDNDLIVIKKYEQIPIIATSELLRRI
jgi:uncharacterized protein